MSLFGLLRAHRVRRRVHHLAVPPRQERDGARAVLGARPRVGHRRVVHPAAPTTCSHRHAAATSRPRRPTPAARRQGRRPARDRWSCCGSLLWAGQRASSWASAGGMVGLDESAPPITTSSISDIEDRSRTAIRVRCDRIGVRGWSRAGQPSGWSAALSSAQDEGRSLACVSRLSPASAGRLAVPRRRCPVRHRSAAATRRRPRPAPGRPRPSYRAATSSPRRCGRARPGSRGRGGRARPAP